MYKRKVLPQYPGFPRMPERPQLGFPQQAGAVATTQDPQQQQQQPMMPGGLLGDMFGKSSPGAGANIAWNTDRTGDILWNQQRTGDIVWNNAMDPYTSAAMTDEAASLGLAGPGGISWDGGMVAGFENHALNEIPGMVAGDAGLAGAESAAIAPAMEAASAAPVVESGLLAGEAAAGAEAAAATAAAEGGLLSGLGGLSVLGPLAGLGILGYLAMENDWF